MRKKINFEIKKECLNCGYLNKEMGNRKYKCYTNFCLAKNLDTNKDSTVIAFFKKIRKTKEKLSILREMKKLITILLLLLTIAVTAKDYEIGYLIVVYENFGNGSTVKRTKDITIAECLLKEKFPNINLDLQHELNYSRYVEIENEETTFYIEVRRINKNGKYRRIKNSHL
jgi:hypothetical protein